MQRSYLRRIISRLDVVSGTLLPFLFWFFLIFGFDLPYVAILTVIAAAVHEGGHLLAIHKTGHQAKTPTPRLFGFKIAAERYASYKDRLLILIAGPLANLVFAALCFMLAGLTRYMLFAGIILVKMDPEYVIMMQTCRSKSVV